MGNENIAKKRRLFDQFQEQTATVGAENQKAGRQQSRLLSMRVLGLAQNMQMHDGF